MKTNWGLQSEKKFHIYSTILSPLAEFSQLASASWSQSSEWYLAFVSIQLNEATVISQTKRVMKKKTVDQSVALDDVL